jgi:AI2M/AI1M-like HNH endonuclease
MSCLSCGSNYRIEMHHVRKMSDLNPKINLIDRLMVKAHRKQIPLCRECHIKKSNKQFTNFLNSVIDGEPYDGKLSRTVREKVYLLVTSTYI